MRFSHFRPGVQVVRATDRSRREGGYVLAMFGLLLVPLLLMVGLAVDVGSWYNRASDIQKAADAASLAGVVWLPDEAKARSVALDVAKKNGFDNAHPDITVTVNKSTKAPRRLKVTIEDRRVGSFFYQNLGGREISVTRDSFAEYVTPVPMGSPRNYFGTGHLVSGDPELLYQSVNPYCTAKANGDQHQSGHSAGSDGSGGSISNSNCTDAPSNPEFWDTGYELYIEAPAGRTSDIDVRLYDARYNWTTLSTTIQTGETCASPGPAYPTDPNAGWIGPWTGTTNISLPTPLQYQTRNNSTTSTWNSIQTKDSGGAVSHRRDRIRYRTPQHTWPTNWTGPVGGTNNLTISGLARYETRSTSTGPWSSTVTLQPHETFTFRRDRLRYMYPTYTPLPEICTPTYTTVNESAIDSTLNSRNNREDFTYKLFAADETPLDDSDNPEICSATYSYDTPFDGSLFLGSRRWNTLCTISSTAPAGRYIVRITNGMAKGNVADGSNQWGLVARYTDEAGDGLCDGRTDAQCPRVYGKEAISVYANTSDGVAAFFLAEIGPEHAGKKLKLELWDPGEGGSQIEIMQPNGANTWTPRSFSWRAEDSGYGPESNVWDVSVAGSRFNAHLLEITVDLTGYAPPANNRWWKIQYTFSDPNRPNVTDRTTWAARILGDPVHLIEEY